ncbi:MAG: IS110 family transposase, partial [Hyphomicrobiales bacterium]|nr:IS110 family transposase [Hyphomicrobiales bacterium]
DGKLTERLAVLETIPGISKITAFPLLIEMPGLGALDGKLAASLAGRAFIRGGGTEIRHALYVPALVATRFNPALKTK